MSILVSYCDMLFPTSLLWVKVFQVFLHHLYSFINFNFFKFIWNISHSVITLNKSSKMMLSLCGYPDVQPYSLNNPSPQISWDVIFNYIFIMLFPSISIVFIIYMLISTSIITIFILYYDLISSKASLLSFLLFKNVHGHCYLVIFPHESGIRSSVPYQKTPKSPTYIFIDITLNIWIYLNKKNYILNAHQVPLHFFTGTCVCSLRIYSGWP